jgi:hypothetical protein
LIITLVYIEENANFFAEIGKNRDQNSGPREKTF